MLIIVEPGCILETGWGSQSGKVDSTFAETLKGDFLDFQGELRYG